MIELTWGETADTPVKINQRTLVTKSLFRPHVH